MVTENEFQSLLLIRRHSSSALQRAFLPSRRICPAAYFCEIIYYRLMSQMELADWTLFQGLFLAEAKL